MAKGLASGRGLQALSEICLVPSNLFVVQESVRLQASCGMSTFARLQHKQGYRCAVLHSFTPISVPVSLDPEHERTGLSHEALELSMEKSGIRQDLRVRCDFVDNTENCKGSDDRVLGVQGKRANLGFTVSTDYAQSGNGEEGVLVIMPNENSVTGYITINPPPTHIILLNSGIARI